MYFDKPEGEQMELTAGMDTHVALLVNGLLMLGLGIYPTWLLGVCGAAFG